MFDEQIKQASELIRPQFGPSWSLNRAIIRGPTSVELESPLDNDLSRALARFAESYTRPGAPWLL